jgi:hypothetical protein
MEEDMSIDKKEDFAREGSDDSMESTPEAEPGLGGPGNPEAQPKRKGGRKPVGTIMQINDHIADVIRFMLPQRNASRETDRLKRHSVSVVPNTSSS